MFKVNVKGRKGKELLMTFKAYLDDVDTLEGSDPAWGLLISIVAQT